MKYQYENTYIGTFIYTFGFVAGKMEIPSNHASFSIFQQTPKDQILSDLFASWKGKNFLIEFKRSANQIKDELKKEPRKQLLHYLKNPEWVAKRNLSKRGHLLCYPHKKSFELMPYLGLEPFSQVEKLDFSRFIKRLLLDNSAYGLTSTELKDYCNFLAKFIPKKSDESGSGTVSGVVVNVNKKMEVTFVEYNDPNFLDRQVELNRELEIIREIKRDRGIDRGGFDLSM